MRGQVQAGWSIMPIMKSERIAVVCCALALSVAPIAMAAPQCDVKAEVPAGARTFAKVSDQSAWREYPSIEEVPELDTNGGMSAQSWQEQNGGPSVYMVEPGEDFWTFARYCFDGKGELERVGFELRTAWGWGYRLEGTVSKEKLGAHSSEFFSTKNRKTIPRPNEAGDIPGALKPTLYLKTGNLPFAQFLFVSPKPNPK